MNRLLHIIASPRGEASRTLGLTKVFLERALERHPLTIVDELDLFSEPLPELHAKTVSGKYLLMGGQKIPEELVPEWKRIEALVNRFQAADTILVSTPMWNFSVPYKLKHYLDLLVQPRHLFWYPNGRQTGLAKPNRAFILTSSGGDYSQDSTSRRFDFVEPYLRAVFGFIGLTDVTCVHAQPMDSGDEAQYKSAFNSAIEAVRRLEI